MLGDVEEHRAWIPPNDPGSELRHVVLLLDHSARLRHDGGPISRHARRDRIGGDTWRDVPDGGGVDDGQWTTGEDGLVRGPVERSDAGS